MAWLQMAGRMCVKQNSIVERESRESGSNQDFINWQKGKKLKDVIAP